jgi:hypothetical protein
MPLKQTKITHFYKTRTSILKNQKKKKFFLDAFSNLTIK